MNFLASICVRRPVFATVFTLVFLVFGVVGYLNLGLDRFPKIDFPIITVTTRLPGSASEEVETEITDKIEEAVNTTSGIDELRSISSEGISQVFVTFVLEKDADIAAQEVRDKVNRVLPDLPKGVEQPFVEKFDPDSTPVMTIAASAPASPRDLTEYCDKVLRRQLESLPGVGQVTIVGGQKRQINVHLDGLKLRSHRLTVADVAKALQSQNLQMPGGTVKAGQREYTLRTMGRVEHVADLEQIPVAQVGPHIVTIGDLGHAEDGAEEIKSLARYNDTPAVLLNVRKQSGTNTVEVTRLLRQRLGELEKLAPADYHIVVVRDQSPFIEAAVDTVKEHLTLGGALAAVVIFFFLANFRTTLISALAIPTSIISAFAVVYFMGFTLNSITLLALALSVGIVIDDAIVVMENIYRYIEEKDCTPREAALAATKEIGLAVLSITLSLLAVFLPIAFMGGIVGRFLKSFGVTMSAAILVSMLISFSLTPMLAARWLKVKRRGGAGAGGGGGGGGGGTGGGGTPHAPREDGGQASSDGDGEASHDGNGQTPQDVIPHAEREEYERHAEREEYKEHAGKKGKAGGSKSGIYHGIESGYMAMLRFSLRRRWVVVLCVAGMMALMPLLLRHGPQELPPRRRPVGVRDRRPRSRRHVAGSHLRDPRPHLPGGTPLGRRRLHADLGGRQRPADRQPGHDLRPHGADPPAAVRPVRDDGLRPPADPAALSQAGPADQRQPGGDLLRGRHVAGRRAVHDRRPRHAEARPLRAESDERPARACRAPWTSIPRWWSASRSTACRWTAPRRPTWASRSPTWPTRCGCWWPATR